MEIIHFNEIDSTNKYAMDNLELLSDKNIIVANIQTNGKGRLGRKWISSENNNVYLSIVLKPTTEINNTLPLTSLTQYMAVIICKELEKYGCEAQIKWPNDVLVDDKKIAGILCESSIQGSHFKGLVLGLGLNTNQKAEVLSCIDQPATSLNLLINKKVDRNAFIKSLAEEFFKEYDIFLQKGFPYIKDDYSKRAFFLGQKVTISHHNNIQTGIAKQILDNGSLELQTENNETSIITIGDMSFANNNLQ